MSAVYKIRSIQTGQFLIASPNLGDRVKTTYLDDPNYFIFSSHIPESGAPTSITIQSRGKRGFYVNPGSSGRHIAWQQTPYVWRVARAPNGYEFFPEDGSDQFWYQNFDTMPFIGLASGNDLVPDEPYFQLIQKFFP